MLGLSRVPDLVRALDGRATIDDIHRALLAADDAGEIELRPESGGEFLSDEDARLCPPGPRGTVLSYARIVKPSSGRLSLAVPRDPRRSRLGRADGRGDAEQGRSDDLILARVDEVAP